MDRELDPIPSESAVIQTYEKEVHRFLSKSVTDSLHKVTATTPGTPISGTVAGPPNPGAQSQRSEVYQLFSH